MMELKCQHVSAGEAGDEIFQVMFEEKPELDDAPYLLISRAFLEEDEGEPSLISVETQDERLIGHYRTVCAELCRDRLTLRLPPPVDETIVVQFTTSDRNFRKVARILGVILQRKFTVEEKKDANNGVHDSLGPRRASAS